MPEKAKKKQCGLCLMAQASARLDQAHDAMAEMAESGLVQAIVATESSLRLEESRFWMSRLEALARSSGAKHRKSCRAA